MKIASFNINNINRRLTNLFNWLREAEPDIVCLSRNQSRGHRVPNGGNPAGGLSCGMPRREALERRSDSRAMGSGGDSHELAR
jgi:hypothetical protein